MFGISTWLAGWDQFGSFAKFNYRGQSGYGTGYGGCCSLIVTIITVFFLLIQMLGFVVSPAYNQSATTVYLSPALNSDQDTSYTIEEGDFMPTFLINVFHNKTGDAIINYTWTPDDPQFYDVYYEQYDYGNEDPPERINATLCTDYIASWSLSDSQKQNATTELESPLHQICPDTDQFILGGGTRGATRKGLRFRVDPMYDKYDFAPGGADEDRINDTKVYTSMINRYFTPEGYNEWGYLFFIAVTEEMFNCQAQKQVLSTLFVMQEAISYYNFWWLDTSQINVIELGTQLEDYKVNDSLRSVISNYINDESIFVTEIVQSRKQSQITWSITSLDLIFGLVGGFTSIIWLGLGLMIAPYEDFKFNASLIGSIYPTSPQRDEDEPPIDNRKEANQYMEGTVVERGKFYYRFSEYYCTWILQGCFCCFLNKDGLWWKKRDFRYKRYEKAVERLNEEIDVLKHVSMQRTSEFISKLILRKHQRALVQSFQKYQLDDMIAEDEAMKRRNQVIDQLASMDDETNDVLDEGQYNLVNQELLTEDQRELLQEIREKFDPVEIVADLCILYEVTGYKDESADTDFWEQYMDFFELGNDENLIRQDRMETEALPPDRRDAYRNYVENTPTASSQRDNIFSQRYNRPGSDQPLLPTINEEQLDPQSRDDQQ